MAVSEYELERIARIEFNRQRMEAMGLVIKAPKQTSILGSFRAGKRGCESSQRKPWASKALPSGLDAPLASRIPIEKRESKRLKGDKPDYAELDSDDEKGVARAYSDDSDRLVDLMERGRVRVKTEAGVEAPLSEAMVADINARRCASQGRGSVYDSNLGITCHFCRQKKLCGEPDCPRCQRRDAAAECIGKTMCTRCHSATGMFCRACLLIRYGEETETVRANTEWLCPHCYEEDSPDAGWICNSSICMKRRGLVPTGIAIYKSQECGFKSVGHYLQAQLKKRADSKAAVECTQTSDASGTTVLNVQEKGSDNSSQGTCTSGASSSPIDPSSTATQEYEPTQNGCHAAAPSGTTSGRSMRGRKACTAAAAASSADAAATISGSTGPEGAAGAAMGDKGRPSKKARKSEPAPLGESNVTVATASLPVVAAPQAEIVGAGALPDARRRSQRTKA